MRAAAAGKAGLGLDGEKGFQDISHQLGEQDHLLEEHAALLDLLRAFLLVVPARGRRRRVGEVLGLDRTHGPVGLGDVGGAAVGEGTPLVLHEEAPGQAPAQALLPGRDLPGGAVEVQAELLADGDQLGGKGPRRGLHLLVALQQQQAGLDGRQLGAVDDVVHRLDGQLLERADVGLGQGRELDVVAPPVQGEDVDGGEQRRRELAVGACVLVEEDALVQDGEAGVDDAEVQIEQLLAVRRDDALDLVRVGVGVGVAGGGLVRVECERGFVRHAAERGDAR